MARVVPTEGDIHDVAPGGSVVVAEPEPTSNNNDEVDTTTLQATQRTAPETQESDPHTGQSLATSENPPHALRLDPSQDAGGEEKQPSAVKEPTSSVIGESGKMREANDDATVGPEPQFKPPSRAAAAVGEEERAQQSQPVGAQVDGVGSVVPKTTRTDSLKVSKMDKHSSSGMTTFSLAHPYTDSSSAAKSGLAQVSMADEAENGTIIGESSTRASTQRSGDESQGDDEEESEPRGFEAITRRGTRRYVPRRSQGAGDDGEGASSTTIIDRKRPPLKVPQTMFMGHPVGSTAAEFLERQKHRVQDIRSQQEKSSRLMKLVMEHSAASSGSPLPDVDVVFPDDRSDRDQGDRCV